MSWVERLAAALGWENLELEIAWEYIESGIGAPLPVDFKEFCRAFGRGIFCDYLTVYSSSGGENIQIIDSLKRSWKAIEQHPIAVNNYKPYGLYSPGAAGVLPWGITTTGCDFAWLVEEGVDPVNWPVLARDDASSWMRYDMTASEFAYRVLLDEAFDFSVASLIDELFYFPEPSE